MSNKNRPAAQQPATRPAVEYVIATRDTTTGLEAIVAELIAEGFRPIGGVAVRYDGRLSLWAQAMTREE